MQAHHYQRDPREITAKYESVCPETGLLIRKGDPCVYFPYNRKTYHISSRSARDWMSQCEADRAGMMDAGW